MDRAEAGPGRVAQGADGGPDGHIDVAAANIGDVRDPHRGYAKARAQGSVHQVDHFGMPVAMVYRHVEANQVLRDDETFSARINGRWMRPLLGRTILEMDHREHFTHRRLIGHAFRPKVVSSWHETLIEPTVRELLEGLARRGEADLVQEFTWQLPVRVFARILGVPDVDFGRWQHWAVCLETAPTDWQRAIDAAEEVRAYFQPAIEARRREPRDDLISDLASAEIEGERLDDDLIHGFIRLLIPAGAGTTYRLLGNLLYALLTNREWLAAVREDRSLIPRAVEETLRWESPVQFAVREPLRDTELGGVRIEAGTPVTVALGSANRDEEVFEHPDRFDPGRETSASHVAFGGGPHRCLGEHLARLEATVALNALLDRFADLRLEPNGHDPHIVGYAFRSPTSLPVRFLPA